MGRVKPPTYDDLIRIGHDGAFAAWALEHWGPEEILNPSIYRCDQGIDDRIGLGDVIKKITNALGLETCSACEARRRKLNRWSVRRIRRKAPARPCNCGRRDA